MPDTPPPTQQQADEAQQARYAAEVAVLALFVSVGGGGGEGEEEESSLHGFKIAAIVALLSAGIISASFRIPQQESAAENEVIAERVVEDAQNVFQELSGSELTDEQAAVLWATWAYSRTADEIAEAFSGEVAGKTLKKVWISRSDAKVRALHAKLHGRTIPTSEDFWRWPDTGQRLRWPGDLEAPTDATIGCRCVCLLTWADENDVSTTIRKIIAETDPN